MNSEQKLAELMLYVARRSEGHSTFGAVKLNKLLWAADFTAYGRTGAAITGQEYFKLENGPAPRKLVPIRKQLLDSGDAAIQKVQTYSGNPQERLIALRDADLSCFTGEQIAIVDEIVERCKRWTGTDASLWSHEFPAWNAAALKETIPYETVFISNRRLTETELRHGETIEPSAR